MSWISDPADYTAEDAFYLKLKDEKEAASRLLLGAGCLNPSYTACMIPLQVCCFLPDGSWIYARNSRVGGDVTVNIFDKEYDLSTAWPNKGEYTRINIHADAWKYTDIAEAIIEGLQRTGHLPWNPESWGKKGLKE